MYKIYAGDELIHSPDAFDVGCYVSAPVLTSEINRASVLEFELPPDCVGYNKVGILKPVIKVYDDDRRIFRGRCLHIDTLMSKTKSVYCEGDLAFLQDTDVAAYQYEGTVENLFKKLVNEHNDKISARKRFRIGRITVEDKNDTIKCESTTYPTTFQEMQTQLLDEVGGVIMSRYAVENGEEVEYLDYLEEASEESSQSISFGENLVDISQRNDGEEIYTVICPLGASSGKKKGGIERRLTIKEVNDGSKYLRNADGIAEYGTIVKTRIWDKVKDADELKQKAQKALAKAANDVTEIELSAIDLHLTDKAIAPIELGKINLIYSKSHGFNKKLPCNKISLDLENPERSTYSFGRMGKTLTGMNHAANKKIDTIGYEVDDIDADLEEEEPIIPEE